MKKIIYNNGKNLEVAFCTNKVKFGKKEFVNPTLTLSSIDNNKEFFTIDFDMSSDRSLYGECDGTTQWLSFFEVTPDCINDVNDVINLVRSIKMFDETISPKMTNSEIADNLVSEYLKWDDDYDAKTYKALIKQTSEFEMIVAAYNNQKGDTAVPNCLYTDDDCKEMLGKYPCLTKVLDEYGEEGLEYWEEYIYLLGECLTEETDCKSYYYSEGLSI